MGKKISLCMIVKDEENNLQRCLDSVAEAVDEIIIVDTGSSDKTVQIAEGAGAKVLSHVWKGDFSAARNAALELAEGEWILFLDADEVLEPSARQALRLAAELDNEGYFIEILNLIGSEGSIEVCPDLVFRMFRNRPENRFHGAIHEQIADVILKNNKQANFQIAENVTIRHYGYLSQQIIEKDKKNRNLAIIKKELENDPDNQTLRYHYGVELFRMNRFVEAAVELTNAANSTDPNAIYYPKLLRYIVMSHYGVRQYDKALEASRLGITLFPNYADLYYYSGLINIGQKNYAGAFESFQKALATPEQPVHYAPFRGSRGFRTHFQIGQLAEAFGNEEEALRYYILSLQDNPNFIAGMAAIVHVLDPCQNPEYTFHSMEKLCDFCTIDAKRIIGTVYFDERAYGLALDYFEKIETASLDDYTKMLKAICLIQHQRTIEARRIIDGILPSNQQYPLAKLNEILCYWLDTNRKKVNRLCDDFLALGLSPDTGGVISILKNSLYKRLSIPPAVIGEEGMSLVKDIVARALDRQKAAHADKLLSLVAKQSLQNNYLDLARIFARYGYWDTAKYYTELHLEYDVDSADAWCQMGEVFHQKKQHEEAGLCYRRALTIDPQQPQYYVKLIRLYQARRKELIAQAAQNFPDTPLFGSLLEELK